MKTVTNDAWNVGAMGSCETGKYVYEFQPFRCNAPFSFEHMLKPGCYGMQFPSIEAYSAFALERGFTQVYYSRPAAFIGLRLSPATRRYLKALPTVKARWDALARILPKTERGSYFRAVKTASYMKGERNRWLNYMRTGGQDPEADPRRRNLKAA